MGSATDVACGVVAQHQTFAAERFNPLELRMHVCLTLASAPQHSRSHWQHYQKGYRFCAMPINYAPKHTGEISLLDIPGVLEHTHHLLCPVVGRCLDCLSTATHAPHNTPHTPHNTPHTHRTIHRIVHRSVLKQIRIDTKTPMYMALGGELCPGVVTLKQSMRHMRDGRWYKGGCAMRTNMKIPPLASFVTQNTFACLPAVPTPVGP